MLVWVYHDCSSRSVCLSVAYITNNSRTQRSSVPTVGRRFPTLDATRKPVSRSKGQRSGSPGPLMHTHTHTHIVRHIFRMAKPTNSNLVYGWRTTTRISHRHHDLQGQRSKSQGHVISLSRVGPMAHKSKTNSRWLVVSPKLAGRKTQVQHFVSRIKKRQRWDVQTMWAYDLDLWLWRS